jgi:predicted nucleic acid-binding protein
LTCEVEVAQVVRRYVMRGDLSPADGGALVELFAAFPVARYPHQPLLSRMWELRDNLTAYDAAYVALAEALGAAVVTRGARLAAAPGVAAAVEVV